MTTTKSTTTKAADIAAQAAAARAEADRLTRAHEAIETAGRDAEHETRLAHYRHVGGPRAAEYRDRRDTLKAELDDLAVADELDLTAMFTAFVAMKEADARCGALNVHGATLNTLDPFPRNEYGVDDRRHVVACNELYSATTWSDYLDRVVGLRCNTARNRHQLALQAEVHDEVQAAGETARQEAARR